MNNKDRQRINNTLKELEVQDQKNKNLINLIQNTNVKDLEEERFKNMSPEEKDLLK